MWIDVRDDYNYNKQLTFKGEYNQDGVKIGYWEIYFKRKQIGGELYNQKGLKDGYQVLVDQTFTTFKRKLLAGICYQGQPKGDWIVTENGIQKLQYGRIQI